MRARLNTLQLVGIILVLASTYALAGKLGLSLAVVHPSATAVWPPSGIALAALLVLGYRVWPGILLGAFLVNITTSGNTVTSFGIAAGNTLEGLVGAYLVNRFANGPHFCERPQDIFKFTVLAGMVSTTVSATLGVISLALGGVAGSANYPSIWLTWWLGDAMGDFIIAPLLVLWTANPRVRWNRHEVMEAAFLLLVLFLVGQVVFGGWLPLQAKHYPLDFLCIPILVWAAFRFGPRETATAAVVLSGIALWGTVRGFGPFVRDSRNESILLLQMFMGTTTVMTLAFAAVVLERKRAEETRARLAAIVESSDDAIIGKTMEGTVISWNRGAERLFGYLAEEVIGKPVTVVIPPDRFHEESQIIERLRQGERLDQFETVRWRKDGQKIYVSLTISPIKDSTGKVVGVSKIVRDITSRIQAEEQFRLIVESAPSGMLMLDQTGVIRMINAQLEKQFGYSRQELLGQRVELLVPERFRAQHATHRANFFASPSVRSMGVGRDLFGVRKDGTEFPIEIGLNPLNTADGPRVLASIVDITERKRTEDQIQASLKEKELLVREVHHRVKNNLQVIYSLLRLQSKSVTDPKALELFQDSQARVKAMALLHETLYQSQDLSRIDMAGYISTLTGQLFKSYGISSDAVRLKLNIAPVSLSMETAITCGLLINELVSNSLKYAFPNGRKGEVTIHLSSNHNGAYTMIVGDNGVGLPPDLDVGAVRSLGWQLVPMLVDQLTGTFELKRSEGTTVNLTFSELSYKGRV
jgi:PAS domain S-box-containing protein